MKPKKQARSVALARFDDVEPNLLRKMASALGKDYPFLKFEAVAESLAFPAARTRWRVTVQYRADDLVAHIRKNPLLAASDLIVGMTARDLYVPELNFVFGLASPPERAAIVSTHRLRNPFNGLPADDAVLLRRALVEAAHELGHLLGLGHCSDRGCVMFFSNTVLDTDAKSYTMCPACRYRVQTAG